MVRFYICAHFPDKLHFVILFAGYGSADDENRRSVRAGSDAMDDGDRRNSGRSSSRSRSHSRSPVAGKRAGNFPHLIGCAMLHLYTCAQLFKSFELSRAAWWSRSSKCV
jgi:hypothetical protein